MKTPDGQYPNVRSNSILNCWELFATSKMYQGEGLQDQINRETEKLTLVEVIE